MEHKEKSKINMMINSLNNNLNSLNIYTSNIGEYLSEDESKRKYKILLDMTFDITNDIQKLYLTMRNLSSIKELSNTEEILSKEICRNIELLKDLEK